MANKKKRCATSFRLHSSFDLAFINFAHFFVVSCTRIWVSQILLARMNLFARYMYVNMHIIYQNDMLFVVCALFLLLVFPLTVHIFLTAMPSKISFSFKYKESDEKRWWNKCTFIVCVQSGVNLKYWMHATRFNKILSLSFLFIFIIYAFEVERIWINATETNGK